jgi:hypothetical protein
LDDLTAVVNSIGESLTTFVRGYAARVGPPDLAEFDPVLARYAPTVMAPIQVVRVRWQWLAYPLALVIGGLLFLLVTTFSTCRYNVLPWKGRRMPLLLADLDDSRPPAHARRPRAAHRAR